MRLLIKKPLYLIWFWLMTMIDLYLIHPIWDRFERETKADDMLCRFCQYAHGGYVLALKRRWKLQNVEEK